MPEPKTVFILGPSIDNVIETSQPAPPPTGRQKVDFDSPAYAPGGLAFLKVLPKSADTDIEPLNVYAFYVPQDKFPAWAARTYSWFFANAPLNASAHAGTADASGKLSINVPGVVPSLTPYVIQIVIEYPS